VPVRDAAALVVAILVVEARVMLWRLLRWLLRPPPTEAAEVRCPV
jgi:hypothetical protein